MMAEHANFQQTKRRVMATSYAHLLLAFAHILQHILKRVSYHGLKQNGRRPRNNSFSQPGTLYMINNEND